MPRDELPPRIVASDDDVTVMLHQDVQRFIWRLQLASAIALTMLLLVAAAVGWLP